MAIKKPTVLELGKDVVDCLEKAGLLGRFMKLPPSHQRQYLSWVEQAKESETRASRIAKMLNMLSK